MAILAGRDMVMAGLLPTIELRLHDVAIDARPRVMSEVTQSFSKSKCEETDSSDHTGDSAEGDAACSCASECHGEEGGTE